MNKEFWLAKILPFLIPNEEMKKLGETCYEVQDKLKIVFLFEGGFKVAGDKNNMSLNLKDPDLMILMLGPNPIKIYRIPYHRLIGFELIRGSKKKEDSISFFRN